MNTVAIIQARMGSSRLPQKVMMPLAGRPMIYHVVERVRRIPGVDKDVVATSTSQREAPLVDYVRSELDVAVVRGPEDDVLRRYLLAASEYRADPIMRITGDCPLISPKVSGLVLRAYLEREKYCDYASNTLKRTFPRGLDTEVFSFGALLRAHRRGTSDAEREHVTLPIYSHPRAFRLLSVLSSRHHPLHRWTVDTAEDYELMCRIFDTLYPKNPAFELKETLMVVEENPHWQEININIRQKPAQPRSGRAGDSR